MEKRTFRDLELSTLMLGTVQLGLPYGIANRTGQPSYRDAVAILEAAVQAGVNALDTAAVYGMSEEVLGRAIAELRLRDGLVVATKVTQMADDGIGAREADLIVERSVTTSLRRLGLERLPICLFHREANFLRYADSLLRLREKGLVLHAGTSVTFPGPGLEVVRDGRAEAIQVPASILDHRFLRAGVLSDAQSAGTALFVRSIYLQGLLLMDEKDVEAEHAAVIPVRRALESIAREAGMGLAELAVRYALSLPGVTCLVIGAETARQVRENAACFERGPLDGALCARVEAAVPDLPETILFPGHWAKRMPAVKPVSTV
jgi:aryl-alcohol dehydrogenase-like predicted oxidoreductase